MMEFSSLMPKLALTGLALIALASCQDVTPDPERTTAARLLTVQEQNNVGSSNDFAFRSFAKLREQEGSQNIFISPLSISMALTMTYNGAGAATKDAMRETLGFEPATDEEINKAYQTLSGLLTGIDKQVTFKAANSLWHSDLYRLQEPFVQQNEASFNATVKALDFTSPQAKDQINNWVKEQTKGKIDKIVEEVRRDHVLFLVNAIYFKGTWTYTFDKKLTKPAPFYREDGSTLTHDFMTLRNGRYLYYQDASKELFDLPYGNKHYSMMLLLPQGQHQVHDVMQELSQENLAAWLSRADTVSRELHLPKFKLAYEKELNETLKQLGMGIAFTDQADFSHMVEGQNKLAISEVKHKAFVEVNEEGTEAAAATSVGISLTSMPAVHRLNKPFIFLIREKTSGAILFIGQLMQPQ